jgi:hypothetical protein
MEIQNSNDISYAKLKSRNQQKTITNMASIIWARTVTFVGERGDATRSDCVCIRNRCIYHCA